MILNQILRTICGIVILLAAFLHIIFLFADLPGCVIYYWIFDDPESMTGLEMFFGFIIGIAIAFIFSVIHTAIYLIIGVLILIFKKNIVVPIFSIIISSISIALSLRVILIFGYVSVYLTLLLVIEIIILVLSISTIIASIIES